MGRAIASARRTAGLTQEELAAETGIDYKRLQKIEAGSVNVTVRTLDRIASVLGVAPGGLLG